MFNISIFVIYICFKYNCASQLGLNVLFIHFVVRKHAKDVTLRRAIAGQGPKHVLQ